MRLLSSASLRSLVPVVLCAAGLSWAAVGCEDGHHHGDGDGSVLAPPDQTITDTPDKVAIDTGATLDTTPGTGVGVFVQYAAGGHWTVTTACDTTTSGQPCGYDVFIVGADRTTTLTNPAGKSLESTDGIEILSDGSLHLATTTSTGLDGVTFDANPGGTIRVEMYLDGVPQPRFVYWIGDSLLHTGAPTDPVDMAPSAP